MMRWYAAGALVAAVVVAVAVVTLGRDGQEESDRSRRLGREIQRPTPVPPELAPQRAAAPRLTRGEGGREQRLRVLARVERTVLDDARARAAAGELRHGVEDLRCERYPATASPQSLVGKPRVRLECLAVTSKIPAGERNVAGFIGYPFYVAVDYERARWAWCKGAPPPGELAVQLDGPRLPSACAEP